MVAVAYNFGRKDNPAEANRLCFLAPVFQSGSNNNRTNVFDERCRTTTLDFILGRRIVHLAAPDHIIWSRFVGRSHSFSLFSPPSFGGSAHHLTSVGVGGGLRLRL